MLDNTIVLPVDTLNTGVTTNLGYTRFDAYNNRTVYISENHDPGSRDLLTFYRTFPKVNGTFKGTRKTSAKFTRDFSVADSAGGTIDSPVIIEISFSIPVGVTAAQILEMRQAAVALLDKDTVMDDLNVLQVV